MAKFTKYNTLKNQFADGIEVVKSDEKGLHVVCKRDVKAGELILSEDAYSYTINDDKNEAMCYGCLSMEHKLRVCEKCYYAWFCSSSCASKHCHDLECSVLQSLKHKKNFFGGDLKFIRLLIHFLTLRYTNVQKDLRANQDNNTGAIVLYDEKLGTETKNAFEDPRFRQVMELKSLFDEWKEDKVESAISMAGTVNAMVDEKVRLPEKELAKLIAICQANSHTISNTSTNEPLGVAVLPAMSKLNHSCRPNACYYFQNYTGFVRVIEDLPSGTEITICYLESLCENTEERRIYLRETYNFLCKCDRCDALCDWAEVILAEIKCTEWKCKGVLRKNETDEVRWLNMELTGQLRICDKCNTEKTEFECEKIENDIINQYKKAMELKDPYKLIRELESVVNANDKHVLCENHRVLFKIFRTLVLCYGMVREVQKLMDTTPMINAQRRVVECMEEIYPENHPDVAIELENLGKFLVDKHLVTNKKKEKKLLLEEAMEVFEAAKEIFIIARGADHKDVKELDERIAKVTSFRRCIGSD